MRLTLLLLAVAPLLMGAAPDWVLHKSPDGTCSLRFPVSPSVTQKDSKTQIGTIRSTTAMASQGKYLYLLIQLDRPEAPEESQRMALVESVANGMRDSHKAVVHAMRDLVVPPGQAAREYVMSIPDQDGQINMVYRVYSVGPRIYSVGLGGQREPVGADQVKQFLDSFQVVPAR